MAPVFGRGFENDDARRGAVVGLLFAQRNFGSGPAALGQILHMEAVAYEIVGVMPASFRFPLSSEAQVWLATSPEPASLSRTAYNYRAVALLKPGVSLDAVNAQLQTIGARLQAAYPDANKDKTFLAVPLQEQLVGPVRTTLYFLMGAVSLVLLIACANVANLLLARAIGRQREMAVRAALGASRTALVRQLLVESGVIASAGCALGLLLALVGTRVLTQATAQQVGLPRLADIQVNWTVLAFAAGVSVIASVLFGLSPAWQAGHVDVNDALKQAGRGVTGSSGRLRSALVVVQVALSFALAIGAGLFMRSFLALTAVDLGFRTQDMLVMYAHDPAHTLDEFLRAGRRLDAAAEQLQQLPGVVSAAGAMGVPTGQYGSNGGYVVDGQDFRQGIGNLVQATFSLSGPRYFSTMGIPLRRGRDFNSSDSFDRPFVAIISESLARQSFGGQDPIGHTIMCGLDSPKWMTVVGVVADTRQDSPASSPGPTLYMPLLQHPYQGNEVQVVMRTSVSPTSLIEPVRSKMRSLAPETATKFTTMEADGVELRRHAPAADDAGRAVCRAGAAARDGRDVRRDDLRHHRAHSRVRRAHGPRRLAAQRARAGAVARGADGGARRRHRRGAGAVRRAGDEQRAVRPEGDRRDHLCRGAGGGDAARGAGGRDPGVARCRCRPGGGAAQRIAGVYFDLSFSHTVTTATCGIGALIGGGAGIGISHRR